MFIDLSFGRFQGNQILVSTTGLVAMNGSASVGIAVPIFAEKIPLD